MALVAVRGGERGKVYLDPSVHPESFPDSKELSERISNTSTKYSITLPNEPIASQPSNSKQNILGITVRPYGLREFRDLFNKRQILSLLTFASALKYVDECAKEAGMDAEYRKSVLTYLACVVDKLADFNSSLCVLKPGGGRGIVHTFGRQVITMVWDYAEANPFNAEIACWESSLKEVVNNLKFFAETAPASVTRASATELPWATGYFDAVITDPPYYDNVPYADISDFFYVWLKRTVGRLFPEHFAAETTPKRQEAVANSARSFRSDARAHRSPFRLSR
jgi:putative DNA methylase